MNGKTLRDPGFSYRRSPSSGRWKLYCEDADLEHLAEELGTPLYVYSSEAVRSRLTRFNQAFQSIPHTICYSVKANPNLALLRLVANHGAGFDVVSGGEIERVLNVDPNLAHKVVFSGVGKTAPEMELGLRSGILLFNIESDEEFAALARIAARLDKRASIAVRVNPDVSAKTHPYISTGLHDHKFGVPILEAQKLYSEALKHSHIDAIGVSVHIGSQITEVGSFKEALLRVAELVRELRSMGHEIRYVDAGGGLGITYQGAQVPFDEQVAGYATAVLEPLRDVGVHLLLEPGRSIAGPAGVLLTRVTYRKTNNSKKFVIVDAAMNDLLRPSLYGAYHEIVKVKAGVDQRDSTDAKETTEVTDVVGPICETGDFFARDRELPITCAGDLLAILDVGAYGAALASNYNSRGRAAEVLVNGAKTTVIRRRETAQEQMRLEK